MKIKIELDDCNSILEQIKQDIERKTTILIERLVKLGVIIANSYYESAPYAGEKDVIVDGISENKFQARIRASGHAVLFIEFGTGVLNADAPEARAELNDSTGIVSHGEYGQGRAKSEKGWFYKGTPGIPIPPGTEPSTKYPGLVHTYGQNATPAMFLTKKYLEEKINQIFQEVFND